MPWLGLKYLRRGHMPVGLDYLDPFLVWHDEFAYLAAPEEKEEEEEEAKEEEKEEETLRCLA